MAVQIRQEINILDHLLTAATGASATSNEIVQYQETQYNGTQTAYFEIVAYSDISLAFSVTLVGDTDGTVATINVPTLTTTPTLFRSSSFNPTTSTQNYTVQISNTVGTNKNVKSARIVIIQNATTLTKTETQIEIGNYNTGRTAESATILTNPKYWKYDASKWDGTVTFYAEAVYDSGSMDTVTIGLYEATDITAPSWSLNATIVSAAETTTPTRTRVAFTPVDGRWYTIFSHNGSMDNHDIYRAGIVVTESLPTAKESHTTGGTSSNVKGSGGTEEAVGQSFTATSSYSLALITVDMDKVGTPTDDVLLEILSGSITGTVLGSSQITTSEVKRNNVRDTDFPFTSAISITSGTKYYLRLTRVGARDTTNYYVVFISTDSSFANGGHYSKSSGSWSSESSTSDWNFSVYDSTITKLEPQYLLANTLFASGTGLQTFLTDWDPTEWDDGAGSITYYFQAEAANGSTSDVTLEEADGGGTVTNSTLTNIDNAQISSAMTMPADQNLDTKATTNAGDVAAARILVTYVFAAEAESPTTTERARGSSRGGSGTLSTPGIYGFLLLILPFLRLWK